MLGASQVVIEKNKLFNALLFRAVPLDIGIGILAILLIQLLFQLAYVENENTPYPQVNSLSTFLPKDSFDTAVFYLADIVKCLKYLLNHPLYRFIALSLISLTLSTELALCVIRNNLPQHVFNICLMFINTCKQLNLLDFINITIIYSEDSSVSFLLKIESINYFSSIVVIVP